MRATGWLRRNSVEVAWGAFALANWGAMIAWPAWETIPFHFVWISLTIVYGFRVWSPPVTAAVLSVVILGTGVSIGADAFGGVQLWGELFEVPLMSAMFLAMVWHARLGYGVGALLLFRLGWGVSGGHWSRFSSFPPSPAAAWRYLREPSPRSAGHNPIGALSVYAMLLFFAFQFASGLFSETKDDFSGPLTTLLSNANVHWLTGYHKNIGRRVLIALVLLHLGAIIYYSVRGRKVVAAMLHGDVFDSTGLPSSRDDAGIRLRAFAVLVLSGLAIWVVAG